MSGENPYFSHGIEFSGLCHNLQNQPPEWAGGLFTKEYDPLRLIAIERQADNIEQSALSGAKAVGELLAVAIRTGELDKNTIESAGWLIKFLADLAQETGVISSSARHTVEHGALI
ncbi:MAG: hypothetical protein K8F27_01840 [Sulfuricellaceae bacterium]|nr:hypothetical protein [Sulfuricellaceae bacterium]